MHIYLAYSRMFLLDGYRKHFVKRQEEHFGGRGYFWNLGRFVIQLRIKIQNDSLRNFMNLELKNVISSLINKVEKNFLQQTND